eukprot:1161676-Pelagomonas_calceolata.AAC.7
MDVTFLLAKTFERCASLTDCVLQSARKRQSSLIAISISTKSQGKLAFVCWIIVHMCISYILAGLFGSSSTTKPQGKQYGSLMSMLKEAGMENITDNLEGYTLIAPSDEVRKRKTFCAQLQTAAHHKYPVQSDLPQQRSQYHSCTTGWTHIQLSKIASKRSSPICIALSASKHPHVCRGVGCGLQLVRTQRMSTLQKELAALIGACLHLLTFWSTAASRASIICLDLMASTKTCSPG